MMTPLPIGIHHGVPDSIYHADPCAQPSLSSGIGRLLLRSPMHARHAHPRLNPLHRERNPSAAMEEGTILHRLILGAGGEVCVIDAPDWRSKAAQAERDAARATGMTPILADRYAELEECADAAREQVGLHAQAGDALHDGNPETTLIWREGTAMCRARVDWMKNDPTAPLVDIKTTAGSAAPEDWERKLIDDYAFQAAFYCRGAAKLRGVKPAGMWFVVIETASPYAISVVTPAPSLMAVAEQQVDEALQTWAECQRSGVWPGYAPYVGHVEAPGWLLSRMDERKTRREIMHEMETAL